MAIVFPASEMGLISQNILNLTPRQATAIEGNGWVDMVDFEGYTTKDIESWFTATARLAVGRGGAIFPSTRVKRILAVSYWVNRRLLRGVAIDPVDFDAAALSRAVADYPIHDMSRDADDKVDEPEQFSYEKLTDWQDSVITFLKGKTNIRKNIPLYYVIRNEPHRFAPGTMTNEDDIIYHALHT